jgi:cobalamin biosynthesis Mg chelatase CobN
MVDGWMPTEAAISQSGTVAPDSSASRRVAGIAAHGTAVPTTGAVASQLVEVLIVVAVVVVILVGVVWLARH